MRPDILPYTLHIYAADEHIGGIEHASFTVKEQVCCSFHSTTYKCLTNIMTKAVIKDSTYWLNSLPSDNIVYDTLSTAAILQVLPTSNYDKLTIDFVPYNQVHIGTNNTTK